MKKMMLLFSVLLLCALIGETGVFSAPKKKPYRRPVAKRMVKKPVKSPSKTMALGAGAGYVYMTGTMSDSYNFAISVPVSFQRAVHNSVSIGLDAYGWMLTSVKSPITMLYWMQAGADARYWFNHAFEGFYLGAGFAAARVSVESEFDGEKATATDIYPGLVVKLGYVITLGESFSLDIGARYDAVDLKDFADKPITIYMMGFIRF